MNLPGRRRASPPDRAACLPDTAPYDHPPDRATCPTRPPYDHSPDRAACLPDTDVRPPPDRAASPAQLRTTPPAPCPSRAPPGLPPVLAIGLGPGGPLLFPAPSAARDAHRADPPAHRPPPHAAPGLGVPAPSPARFDGSHATP
ncbi:hypothetical protein GCM10020256_70000 [Streptomyces thermocoprophilus]